MNPTNDRGEISAFNEGALQMQRIHELQSRVNLLNISPLFKDINTGRYNYEIIFSCLNSLFAECSSKLSEGEMKEGIKKRKEILDFLSGNPIFTKPYLSTQNCKEVIRIDIYSDNWNKLQELLFSYELKIRYFLEKHNLTAPKGEKPERAAYK